ncbi:phosphoribosylformimino-5-aminoimidazole carboxamide ribotide isomerase [Ruminococcaceae bacterium BL-6]|nr:phosphoribosylformimino-5-aminoimidazole carboxamide ribotide isomerase [Ruminococcaceae bacterium BL-6]
MIVFPAIDIKGGVCVRLYQGDYATAHKVAEDPLATARSFFRAGARWVHLVDLDGAKEKRPVNSAVFLKIAEQSGLMTEVGGGIRTMETVDFYLSHGISRVILGSAALGDPGFVRLAVKRYGGKIAVGIDARNGRVASEGWTKESDIDYLEFAKEMEDAGVKHIIFTDISKDGMLSGPNFEMLDRLNNAVSCEITASGGISNLRNIANLRDLGLYGAICGKALYAGKLDLAAAVKAAREGQKI